MTICVSVGLFFSILTSDDIGQHEMAFFSAEGGLLHNSHKKRSLLIVFCRVVYAHIMRARVCVCMCETVINQTFNPFKLEVVSVQQCQTAQLFPFFEKRKVLFFLMHRPHI